MMSCLESIECLLEMRDNKQSIAVCVMSAFIRETENVTEAKLWTEDHGRSS